MRNASRTVLRDTCRALDSAASGSGVPGANRPSKMFSLMTSAARSAAVGSGRRAGRSAGRAAEPRPRWTNAFLRLVATLAVRPRWRDRPLPLIWLTGGGGGAVLDALAGRLTSPGRYQVPHAPAHPRAEPGPPTGPPPPNVSRPAPAPGPANGPPPKDARRLKNGALP